MGNLRGSPFFVKGGYTLNEYDIDVLDEEHRWLGFFRGLGFPATNLYVNKVKKGLRCKVRLVYSEEPDVSEVRQILRDLEMSPSYGEALAFRVIDQGWKPAGYKREAGYVVDIVFMSPEPRSTQEVFDEDLDNITSLGELVPHLQAKRYEEVE